MPLILVSLCGLISCVSQHKHLLVHLSCHSITKTKLGPFNSCEGERVMDTHCWAGQAAQARPPLYSPTVTSYPCAAAFQYHGDGAMKCELAPPAPATSHSDPVRRTGRGKRCHVHVPVSGVTENSEALFFKPLFSCKVQNFKSITSKKNLTYMKY